MIDLGFDKLAMIGVVALVVIGPERLPRVARTVGHLLGKAQRYVADVKAEVNRSIELEDLKKMKTEFEDAARNVEQTVSREVLQAGSELEQVWGEAAGQTGASSAAGTSSYEPPPPAYKHPGKNWRVKRSAVPQWYRQRNGLRSKAQSGAARVARFRPPRSSSSKAGL
ncbi:Sec-independent protein translocase protein TatB [Caldimonas tepidiphila]|uniref:Sec-independent protein translocase protein TatB n=1 Tax=Caldimonas tepidiphila TaxID=2315841 RepID=UPI000E5BE465|nr:Sec-independent protein translocase protein TatB [Caldimonas tepidiphila]